MNKTKHGNRQFRRLNVERLDQRFLLAADFENPGNQLDVNDDFSISPFDALLVINHLSAESRLEPDAPELVPEHFVNVSGDDDITPFDALIIINRLAKEEPEVTLRLKLDTQHDEGGTQDDRRTFHIALDGKVNFGGQSPPLFLAQGDIGNETWVDLSNQVLEDGSFALTDAQVRQALGGSLATGTKTLQFASSANGDNLRDLEIELLPAPPLPTLVLSEISEDSEAILDIEGHTYDPDSAPDAVRLEILQEPSNGEWIEQEDHFVYRPNPNYHGTEFVVYEVSDENESLGQTTLTITIESVNDVPEVTEVTEQAINVSDGLIEIPFTATDEDGEPLEHIAFATVPNPLREIADQYNLTYAGDDYFNLTGLNEKWLFGNLPAPTDPDAQGEEVTTPQAFFILPDGDLIRWQGTYQETGDRTSLVASLDQTVYNDPALLWNAPEELIAPIAVHVDTDEEKLVVVPDEGLFGEINVTVITSDAELDQVQQFKVMIDSAPENTTQTGLIQDILDRASELTHETTLDFIGSVSAQLDQFDTESAKQLIRMMEDLRNNYFTTETQLQKSREWQETETLHRKQQVDRVEFVQQELAVLKTEFETAWSRYEAVRDDSIVPRYSEMFPIPAEAPGFYANGTSSFYEHSLRTDPLTRISIYQGEPFTLDFKALELDDYSPDYALEIFDEDFNPIDEAVHGEYFFSGGQLNWSPARTGIFNISIRTDDLTQIEAQQWVSIHVGFNDPYVTRLTSHQEFVDPRGGEEITLSANAYHPRERIDRVYFYQDVDEDFELDENVDKLLGVDASGADGWSVSSETVPTDSDDSSTAFFAYAVVENGTTIVSLYETLLVPKAQGAVTFDLADPDYEAAVLVDSVSISETTLDVDEDYDIQFSLTNNSSESFDSIDVAVYLSHDDNVDATDLFLGGGTLDVTMQPGQTIDLADSGNLNLATSFWSKGTTDLQLIVSLPRFSSQAIAEIDFVRVDLTGDATVETTINTDVLPKPMAPVTAPVSPRYIRPHAVNDLIESGQGSAGSLNDNEVREQIDRFQSSLEMPQLLAHQFISSAKRLQSGVPESLKNQIDGAIAVVEERLAAAQQAAIEAANERTRIIDEATRVRDAKEAAADAEYESKLDLEQTAKTNIQTGLQAQMAALDAALRPLFEITEGRRIRASLRKAKAQLKGLNGSADQIQKTLDSIGAQGEQIAAQGELIELPSLDETESLLLAFSVADVVPAPIKKLGGKISSAGKKCASDPVQCGKDALEQLGREARRLRDKAIQKLEPLIDRLEDELDNLADVVTGRIAPVIQPLQKAFDDAGDAFEEKKSSLLKARDKAKTAATKAYDDAVAKAPTAQDVYNIAKEFPIEVLEKVPEGLDEILSDVAAPEGPLVFAQDELAKVGVDNPFETTDAILADPSSTIDIATGPLTDLRDRLLPDVSPEDLIDSASEFRDWVSQSGGQGIDWVQENGANAADWIANNVGDSLNEEVIALKAASDFEFSVNLANGSSFLEANITPTISYDSKKFGELLNGNFPFPDVDLLATAGEFYGVRFVKTNDYQEVRRGLYDQHGPQNVYFASDRFVDYFNGETAVTAVAELVATQGESAETLLKEIAEQVRLEFNDILSWLGQKGQQQLEAMIPDLFNAVLTRTPIDLPELTVQFAPVTFTYSVEPAGLAGKYLDIVEAVTGEEVSIERLAGGRTLGAEVPSPGFSLIWKEPEDVDPLLPNNIDAELSGDLDTFNFEQFSEPGLTGDLVDIAIAELESVAPDEVMDILNVMTGVINDAADLQARIAADVSAALSLDAQLVLENYINGNPIVDLSGTPAAARLNELLAKITFGNQGSVQPRQFTLNLSTMVLEIDGTLCHQHSWGTVGDLVAGLAPGLDL